MVRRTCHTCELFQRYGMHIHGQIGRGLEQAADEQALQQLQRQALASHL